MILTQSTLEHFEEDLLFFRHGAAFVAEAESAILQCNLIPSAPCLSTFPWHGVREYMPRTISRLFDDRTQFYLFGLGGRQCNALHRNSITWPRYRRGIDMRYEDTTGYNTSLREAILDDFADADGAPAFYALVLASGFKQQPFNDWLT